jgi:hypothetical protein
LIRRRIEIAHRDDDMIETENMFERHGAPFS